MIRRNVENILMSIYPLSEGEKFKLEAKNTNDKVKIIGEVMEVNEVYNETEIVTDSEIEEGTISRSALEQAINDSCICIYHTRLDQAYNGDTFDKSSDVYISISRDYDNLLVTKFETIS